MTQHITIGQIDVWKPNIIELTDNGFEERVDDFYEFRVNECPISDYDICGYYPRESICQMNIHAFPIFWFKIISESLSNKLKLSDHSAIITPEGLSEVTSMIVIHEPFFTLCDMSILPLKPLIYEIKNLPDDCGDEYSPDDNEYFNDVMKWFKYWSIKAVELYDEDAYIEFC